MLERVVNAPTATADSKNAQEVRAGACAAAAAAAAGAATAGASAATVEREGGELAAIEWLSSA